MILPTAMIALTVNRNLSLAEPQPKKKSNQIAFILSGIHPGLGQFYNEDWAKGIGFFVGAFFLFGLLLPESYLEILRGKVPLSWNLISRLLVLAAFWGLSIYDADRSAKRKTPSSQNPI